MPGIAVSRLHVRAPSGSIATTQARTEDALRLAAPDGERMLLLRRLDLGRIPLRARPELWTARAAAVVKAQGASAIHGAAPGAASAAAVWFQSAEEAQHLLLRELAAGRRPSAWFWRLAVPEWDGATLDNWLPRLVADTIGNTRAEAALARAIAIIAADGLLTELSFALALAPLPPLPYVSEPAVLSEPRFSTDAQNFRNVSLERAQRIFLRHGLFVRLSFARVLAAAPAQGPARIWLARFALIAAAPELAHEPTLLATTAAALIESILAAASNSGEQAFAGHDGGLSRAWTTEAGKSELRRDAPADDGIAVDPTPTTPTPAAGSKLRASQKTAPVPKARADPVTEMASVGAGVFLLVRPLTKMGFASWLERHPALAADGFPCALLRTIATRMGVPKNDPLFALLEGDDDPQWHDVTTAWRVGLDRWLRRNVRRRLSEVVLRRGWLMNNGELLAVRFRLESADIRLRRHALDTDPGWVPWLMRSIRYYYSDRPLE